MNRTLLLLALVTSYSLFAGADCRFDQMEEIEAQEEAQKNVPHMQLRLVRNTACKLKDKQREKLEKVYGEKFAEQTLFFQVAAFSNCAYFGFRGPHTEPGEGLPAELPQLPAYISYDDVKDAKEDDILQLKLFGKVYSIKCKQHDQWQPFERLVNQYLPEKE